MSVPVQGEVTNIGFTIEIVHVTADVAVSNAIEQRIFRSDWLPTNVFGTLAKQSEIMAIVSNVIPSEHINSLGMTLLTGELAHLE